MEDIENLNEKTWNIIESYFNDNYLTQLVRHQLDSYNNFVSYQIRKTIAMFNPIITTCIPNDNENIAIKIYITFNNVRLFRPEIYENNGSSKVMFPNDARLRNSTYTSKLSGDISIKYEILNKENNTTETIINKIPKINIGKIPIMVKSDICVLKQYKINNECKYDTGGYFIINGSEKTVIAQERSAENQVFCFNTKKSVSKWSWVSEIRCIHEDQQISPKLTSVVMSSNNEEGQTSMYLTHSKIKTPIPIFIVFRAYGIISDKEICNYILLNLKDNSELLNNLKQCIIDSNSIITQENAIKYISSHIFYSYWNSSPDPSAKIKYTETILNDDILVHCNTNKEKALFLGYIINKLLKTSMGIIPETDRDSYINKRIDTCGSLLNNLFRNYFNKMTKDMQKQIKREINNGSWKCKNDYIKIINNTNVYKIIKSSTIENGLKRALSTGDFGLKYNTNKVGVAQVVNRMTYTATLSHLRRVNTPIDKNGKLIAPRKLHNTTWGFLCPAETPEGQSVGVVKNLSYLTHITIPSNKESIYLYLLPKITLLDDINDICQIHNKVKVIFNGKWCGISETPYELYNYLKGIKSQGLISITTSVVFNYSELEINICNLAGRLVRPVFKLGNDISLFTENLKKVFADDTVVWNDLLLPFKYDTNIIEYIDPSEQNNLLIAMKLKLLQKSKDNYTHCELHPSSIFGILASCIPFPEHNQSPRNTYQCAMGKQAMGVPVTNYNIRMDKTSNVLTYPMRPLVDTRVMNFINLHKIPSGKTVIVAIMTYSGYNQEDSILFNRASIDRGLFAATIYNTEKDEDKKLFGDIEIRTKPDPKKTKGMKFGIYDKLNNNGIIPDNTFIENRDIIMGKIIPIKENRNDNTKVVKYQDHSKIYMTNEDTYIDKTVINKSSDGYNICKIKLRAFRKPVIGDKFSSRHGQKGTIGNIIEEKDMPFTSCGLKPDIIINPHAIPSRMTIAQLKETLLGKVLLELGLFGDGTPFEELDINIIRKELLKHNYEQSGNELLYNGMTGEQLECSIFMGPCYYQRLKHMVTDKYHSRSIGPMVNLTRQPAEGRSKDGGLRFGEMERDCMISHGASKFTKERIYDSSDKYTIYSCNYCGKIAAYNKKMHIYNCNLCENTVAFSKINIPYACKLLFQELTTMNIFPRIITENTLTN